MDTSFKLQRLRRSDQFTREAKRYNFQSKSQNLASGHADADDEHYDDDDDENNVDVDDGEDDSGIVLLLHRSVRDLVSDQN